MYRNELDAEYWGSGIPLGFNNGNFADALSEQPEDGWGKRFEAFVIPKKCPTFKKIESAVQYKQPELKDVHTRHCCPVHGCKYSDAACTVVNRTAPPEYPCEDCYRAMQGDDPAYPEEIVAIAKLWPDKHWNS